MRVLQELDAGEVVEVVGVGEGLDELGAVLVRGWGAGKMDRRVGLGVGRWSGVGLRVGRS